MAELSGIDRAALPLVTQTRSNSNSLTVSLVGREGERESRGSREMRTAMERGRVGPVTSTNEHKDCRPDNLTSTWSGEGGRGGRGREREGGEREREREREREKTDRQ